MTLYYQCLQCGEEFPALPGKKESKFCSNDPCYQTYRKIHGTEKVKTTPSIFLREESVPRKRRPSKAKPAVSITTTSPVVDIPVVDPTTTIEPEDQQNDAIGFEDLSISDLKTIMSDLLTQIGERDVEISNLHTHLNVRESQPSMLKDLVSSFIKQVSTLDGQLCLGCKKPFNPLSGDQYFCTPMCAKTNLPPNSTMRLHDGTIVHGVQTVLPSPPPKDRSVLE